MIGRQEELEALVVALLQGANQVVGGPRRTGKTTLCRAAVARLADQGLYTVSVDLFGLSNLDELVDEIVAQAVANRPLVRRALERAKEIGTHASEWRRLVPVVRLRTDLGPEVELALEPSGKQSSDEQRLRSALRLVASLARVDGKRLVLFLDEAQELGDAGAPFGDPDRVTKAMRSVLQNAEGVVTLFAGSQEHLLRDLFTPRKRAFYGWASWSRLEPIASSAWATGLQSRFETIGLHARDTALRRIIELGEGHARTTMLLAQQSSIAAVLEGAREVDDAIVEFSLQAAMAADYALHQEVVVELRRLTRYAPMVAKRIARREPPYAVGVASSSVQRAIEALDRSGLVERRGVPGRGGWQVVDPLVRRFLAATVL
jgi:hypothetical protein